MRVKLYAILAIDGGRFQGQGQLVGVSAFPNPSSGSPSRSEVRAPPGSAESTQPQSKSSWPSFCSLLSLITSLVPPWRVVHRLASRRSRCSVRSKSSRSGQSLRNFRRVRALAMVTASRIGPRHYTKSLSPFSRRSRWDRRSFPINLPPTTANRKNDSQRLMAGLLPPLERA